MAIWQQRAFDPFCQAARNGRHLRIAVELIEKPWGNVRADGGLTSAEQNTNIRDGERDCLVGRPPFSGN